MCINIGEKCLEESMSHTCLKAPKFPTQPGSIVFTVTNLPPIESVQVP